MITLDIAGIPVGVDNKFPYFEEFAKDYTTDRTPLFTVSVDKADRDREHTMLDYDFTDGYLESIAVYRKIAEALASHAACVFHGAAIVAAGKAYIFTAKSGTGKTTHIRLWGEAFGSRIKVLNGDKPVLRLIDGVPYAAGTPWRGKEEYGMPGMYPIGGVIFLSRGEENSVTPVSSDAALIPFFKQIYLPRADAQGTAAAMSLCDSILGSVPLFSLHCNMNPDAATVAARGIFGDAFDTFVQ